MCRMWFQVLSLCIAAALIIKAAVALVWPQPFYERRRRQYSSEKLPRKLVVPAFVVLALTLISWYAAMLHYQPWAWIVTAFLSLVSVIAFRHLLSWRAHRLAMLKLIASPRIRSLDWFLVSLGFFFLAMSIWVY